MNRAIGMRAVSPPEARAWISHHTSPDPAEQNMVQAYRLPGQPPMARLYRNTAILLDRHATLRTSYVLDAAGDLVASVGPIPDELPVRQVDARKGGEALAYLLVQQEVGSEFDITAPPLLRVLVVRVEDDAYWIAVVIHHIAADGDSFGTVWADLFGEPDTWSPADAAHGEVPAPYHPPSSYREHRPYWNQRASAIAAALDAMPAPVEAPDAEPPAALHVDASVWQSVIELAHAGGVTPFIVVIAAFSRALCRLLGVDKIVLGISVSTRQPGQHDAVVGNYQNIIPVVLGPEGVDPTGDLLFDALEHATMPLEDIMLLVRGGSHRFDRQPISVTATTLPARVPVRCFGGATAEPVLVVQGGSKTALSMYLEVQRDRAIVHVAGGTGRKLAATSLVVAELQRELSALTTAAAPVGGGIEL